MKIILASGSPRRKEILKRLGYEFEIIKAENDEITDKTKPYDVVQDLSYKKALEVKDKVLNKIALGELDSDDKYCIVAADTIVAYDDIILGKPSDKDEAFHMINMLSGHKHQVYTGVSIINLEDGLENVFYDKTDVYVKNMSEKEIKEYVATGECDDKAGSYAIQGLFSEYIEKYEGDYDNVVGLPATKVDGILKKMMADS